MSFPGYPVRSRAAQVAAMLLALSAVGLVSGCDSDDESAGADATTEDGASSGAGTASAERIRARIIGNTVGGTMSPDSSYTEYYAEDGTIHGPGYEAEWRIDGEEGRLLRRAWPTLYPVNANQAGPEIVVLDGVETIRLRSHWPGEGWIDGFHLATVSERGAVDGSELDEDRGAGAPEIYSDRLPQAIEITLEIRKVGRITLVEYMQ